jgi:hypothetical protein
MLVENARKSSHLTVASQMETLGPEAQSKRASFPSPFLALFTSLSILTS